jgi:hypothetical protein
MFVDPLFSEVVTWPVAAHVEKQGFGAQGWRFSALARCRGRLGALEIERLIGAEAGAWGGKSSRRRFGFLSQVVGSGGVTDCVLSRREGRVSCAIGGVGWWLKRVRVSEIARQVSNSQWFGWRGLSANEVSGPLRSSGGSWCRGVSVGIGLGCGLLRFWGKLLCAVAGRGGGASQALGPGANTALKLTWLSGSGKRQTTRIW